MKSEEIKRDKLYSLYLGSYLYFGKYKGMRVQDVIEKDVNYVKWLINSFDGFVDERVIQRINDKM